MEFSGISAKSLRKIIDLLDPCMDDYLYLYDYKNDYYYISPDAAKRFLLPSHQFTDVFTAFAQFVYPNDLDNLKVELNETFEGRKPFHNLQYRWITKDGKPVWINCRGFVIRDEDGTDYLIGCINEIGLSQKADNISGLLSVTNLQHWLDDFNGTLPDGYFLRLGLDDFKEINEKIGVEYGDFVLKKTADIISSFLLPNQKLYKVVADEYLIVDLSGGNAVDAHAQYSKIRCALDDFVAENYYNAMFTISAGVLECKHITNCSYSNIMKITEFSLNEAKRQGKNRSYYFQSSDYDTYLRKKKLTQLLRQSVKDNCVGFEAYLQPLFHCVTNSIYGAEALLRFHTDEFGMVSPGEFIPILEETGLIIPVGRWMLHRSLAIAHDFQQVKPDFKISVNISYIQIMKSNIISEIIYAINTHHMDPSSIIIELTESGQLESDSRFSKLWSKLKDQGVQLALDDFGTGYSNFHYLNDLKPDIIKIDRSFTLKALQNDYEYNLLALMSGMVHKLNLKVCIEGIEYKEELQKMRQLFPDYCQGYYFGKPMEVEQFRTSFILS